LIAPVKSFIGNAEAVIDGPLPAILIVLVAKNKFLATKILTQQNPRNENSL
jgi:hypothetical protein